MHDNPANLETPPPQPTPHVPWGKFFLVLLLVFVGVVFLLRIGRWRSDQADKRVHCMMCLRNIGMALNQYYSVHGAYPPAYTVDAAGKPLHSWRTLILPYLDEQALYNSIDLTKPWDDPVNARARQTAVPWYTCPAAEVPTDTNYLAIVTSQSCIRPGKSATRWELTDDPAKTVIVMEVGEEKAVPWMAPTDVDEAFFVGQPAEAANWPHRHLLMADFSIRDFEPSLSAAERRAMITIAGGEK